MKLVANSIKVNVYYYIGKEELSISEGKYLTQHKEGNG